MTFGARLDKAMKLRGVDIATLAKACECKYQSIAQVIKGSSRSLSAENTAKAARYLHVSCYWLATGKGPMDGDPVRDISPMGIEVLEWFEGMTNRAKQARAHSYIYGMCVADRWPDDVPSPPVPAPSPAPETTEPSKTPRG
jgi:transcriptional regulator with XRE-family HTH domain